LAYLEGELSDRGMTEVSVTATGCLKACDRGPILVVYPDNTWYGGVEGEEAIDAILDSLASGKPAEAYILK
jgi:(2Fe-2S) ferredoxin